MPLQSFYDPASRISYLTSHFKHFRFSAFQHSRFLLWFVAASVPWSVVRGPWSQFQHVRLSVHQLLHLLAFQRFSVSAFERFFSSHRPFLSLPSPSSHRDKLQFVGSFFGHRSQAVVFLFLARTSFVSLVRPSAAGGCIPARGSRGIIRLVRHRVLTVLRAI